jgi:peptide/nickel transport system substrate-binding protein
MYTNSTVDTLLEQARNATDQEKKSIILEKIETEITRDIPAIFLYSPDFIYIIPKNLKGVSINTITGTSERFLDVHKWYIDTIKVWNVFAN